MSEIIDFYCGKQTSCPLYFSEVFRLGNTDVELCHDFIQYIFPLKEASLYNKDAPILTDEDINIFKTSPVFQWRALALVNWYVKFLHFNIHWVAKSNHNHLRVTRMLKFLVLIGLKDIAKARLEEIKIISRAVDPNVNMSIPIKFWSEACE